MTDEEKKAIENIKAELDINEFMPRLVFNCDDIETLLNLIEKQDKAINEMAEMLLKDHEWFYSEFDNYTVEDFIKYFEKKVGK